ncbi:hypothetical protein [Ectobacillus panaciterrae]|uniref:hypothetical protein n=1 Tax=Ectobacillus panaciterrae TaxID=363872 RepID=UPI0004065D1C|nr:hypothetical protein [Ectobacillus panaciterrae]
MEQTSQKFIKMLLVINLVLSSVAVIGVGYLVYKDSKKTNITRMNRNGGWPTIQGGVNKQNQQEQPAQSQ